MNLRDLRYLVAVGDQRHFGRAAKACFVSQPTLSAQVKKLEEYLGVQLVERGTRQVLLTPTGEEVVARARAVLNQVDDIVELCRAAAEPMTGELRLGAIPTLAPYLLPHLVATATDAWPRLRMLLYEERTALLVERLRKGELDGALMAMPVAGDDLTSVAVFEEPFVLALPADHALAEAKRAPRPEALPEDELLLLEEGHCLRDQALEVCQLAGDAGGTSCFRATSLETLRQMVAAGVGMTLLPRLAGQAGCEIPNRSAVKLLPFPPPVPTRTIGLYWRKGAARASTLEAVAAAIRDLRVVQEQARPIEPAATG
ncbi:LysR substrate-binding domain-containing protein [Alkalilimnicola ehrlichii]|uniref:LysR substrate-binding domain-containing protein n=1 Tax=Alkalilimnicola ehrlichii TaxID=351052 RepID=UPI003BA1A79D